MIERGDYISPTFNYQPRFNKPVLSYWIVAGFYKAFGVSVGVQRIPDRARRRHHDSDRVLSGAERSVPPNGSASKADAMEAAPVGRASAWRSRRGCDVRAPHLHRHLHLDVHGAHAAVLRAGRALPGSAGGCSCC